MTSIAEMTASKCERTRGLPIPFLSSHSHTAVIGIGPIPIPTCLHVDNWP